MSSHTHTHSRVVVWDKSVLFFSLWYSLIRRRVYSKKSICHSYWIRITVAYTTVHFFFCINFSSDLSIRTEVCTFNSRDTDVDFKTKITQLASRISRYLSVEEYALTGLRVECFTFRSEQNIKNIIAVSKSTYLGCTRVCNHFNDE